MQVVRYGNRKLYSMDTKRHIAYRDIEIALQSGQRVSVVCHKTRRDITAETLTALLCANEMRLSSMNNVGVLVSIIRKGNAAFTPHLDFASLKQGGDNEQ